MSKCHSCENGFNGRNGEDKNLLKKALSQHLKENPLYSKRNKIIAVPESEFQIIQPYYKRASFVFVLGLVIGSLLTYFA
jgi:hypothetical protein